MKTAVEFRICPNCGSTGYMEGYPVTGKRTCTKCGHENTKIKLKVIKTEREIMDQCPFCGKEGEEDDTLFENDDTVIFKCKKCGKLDGYIYVFLDFPEYPDEISDRSYATLSVEIAKQEGKFINPASKYQEFEKRLRKKEKSPIEKCKKQLRLLIYDENQEMKTAGLSYKTIGSARRKVYSFLESEGPLTNKQLKSIFPAALLLVQNSDPINFGRILGKKVTERQLEGIFGVTRKTIRKWRKRLSRRINNFYL